MERLFKSDIKAALKRKEKVSVAWLQMCSSIAAEIIGNAGFDVLMIDVEHSPAGFTDVLSMCQAIKASGAAPFARAPWNDMVAIKRILDCGVTGIWVPYVSTKEEAEYAVKACKYPTQGTRGIAGSHRAAGYGMNTGDYLHRANDEITVMVCIETATAAKNVDEILTVDDLDGVCIGPTDLSSSMGHLADPSNPETQALIREIEKKVLASGKFLATVAPSFEAAKILYDRGYSYVAYMYDGTDLAKLAKSNVDRFNEAYR